MADETQQRISATLIEQEMKQSYLDYSMSVIVGRALPDARDGLKPVHRRILYAMFREGLVPTKKFSKCAGVVGEVLKKYHPHGDSAVYDALVRLAQPWSLRYPLIHGQGNFGCFTKDTRVLLTDGRTLSFAELIAEDVQGKKNYTYTITSHGTITLAPIIAPRLTNPHAEIMKVILDNGEEIRCTLNHLFMLRNGSYKEAQYLCAGDSLMPCYTKLSTTTDRLSRAGYGLLYQPSSSQWVPAHHLADNYNLTQGVYALSAGRVRHHKDFNKLNNNPENIQRIQWGDHWKIHYDHAQAQHANPAYRNSLAIGRQKFWSDPQNRQNYALRLSARNKKNWQDPTYREKMRRFLSRVNKAYMQNHPEKIKEIGQRSSRILRRLWQNPEYRARKSNALKAKWQDPLYRQEQTDRMREISQKIWSESSHRQFISENSKKNWQDPLCRQRMISAASAAGKNANYNRFRVVCKKTLALYGELTAETYEQTRVQYNERNGAGIIRFAEGLEKFYDGDLQKFYLTEDLVTTQPLNHKVRDVVFLHEYADVYDLTIEKTHNFALASGVFVHNSQDGDAAASYRYTEAKMHRFAEELLADIDKATVALVDNFDGTVQEPTVLPARVPNLLVNGSSGIAVGMATNIPPHNLSEVCTGAIALLENPELPVLDLLAHISGPDFPTGGIICGTAGIRSAYKHGTGKIILRAKTHFEEQTIIVTEIPYMVNKSLLLESIATLVRDKQIEGISNLRDESDREGMRIVIELKRDAQAEVVLNQLFKHTSLQTTFGVIMLALVGQQPRVLSLKEMLQVFLDHRKEVTSRRCQFDLTAAEERAHLLEGLRIALAHIDAIVALLKQSADASRAREQLIVVYTLSEKQAQAILDMKLQRLTSLEQEKIAQEYQELMTFIADLRDILARPERIVAIIKDELLLLQQQYGDARRTQIAADVEAGVADEDLIEAEEMIVTLTQSGYVKRVPVETYRAQRRGGKGIVATTTKEEDTVADVFVAHTHSFILCFTNTGQVHWLKTYQIPEGSRYARGGSLVNLLHLDSGEQVQAMIPVRAFSAHHFLVMATKQGIVKKTALDLYSRPRHGGIIALTLHEGDELVTVKMTDGDQTLLFATADGRAVKCHESDIRAVGRSGAGVRGISVRDSFVVAMELCSAPTVLTVTELGYGKRSPVDEYRLISRGGSGVINLKVTEKTGPVVDVKVVADADDVLFISRKGIIIRTPVSGISVIGRNTQGVRVMRLESDDTLSGVARIAGEEELTRTTQDTASGHMESVLDALAGVGEEENGNGAPVAAPEESEEKEL